MSSKFWLQSDDEWDEDIYSSDSGDEKEETKHVAAHSRFDVDELSDSDEEDSKRVSRSAHEKSWDELNKSIKVLKNKMLINDWNTVATGALLPRKCGAFVPGSALITCHSFFGLVSTLAISNGHCQ